MKRFYCAVIGGVAVWLTAIPALAQSDTNAISQCAAIDDDARRLECYDRASGRARAVIPEPPAAKAPERPPSLLGKAWTLEPEAGEEVFKLDFHRPNYLLFARRTDSVNRQPTSPAFQETVSPAMLDSVETKLQISFKTRLWLSDDRRWGLWAAYTQQNHWQVDNSQLSRPFRETNYQPEAILTYRPDLELGGFRWRILNLGLNHQSNGRSDPLSRSWNRVYAEFGVERGNFGLLVRPWYRIPESDKTDDNPDITDFYGYGDITALYKWNGHTFTAMGRGNPNTGKGALQLSWSTPRLVGRFKGYVQLFSGYGESLIDYNFRQTTIGIGVTLNDDL